MCSMPAGVVAGFNSAEDRAELWRWQGLSAAPLLVLLLLHVAWAVGILLLLPLPAMVGS